MDFYNAMSFVDLFRKNSKPLKVAITKYIMRSQQETGVIAASCRGYATNLMSKVNLSTSYEQNIQFINMFINTVRYKNGQF